jgi:phosphoenolpyruvate carboxylase
LTAHPTEVQRKSILDAERAIAALLSAKDAPDLLPREHDKLMGQLRARVTQLWQTRLLRYSKLSVADEIENALSYYEATFLREIPKLYADIEERVGPIEPAFFRMGNWIGGDRDGNPNVTAATLKQALSRQCEVALRHYLRSSLSWCRAFHVLNAGRHQRRDDPSGCTQSRPKFAPLGRAVSKGSDWHICAPSGYPDAAHGYRSRTTCRGAGQTLS